MDILGLTVGALLPWILGLVWIRARWLKPAEINWPTLLGYGYLAGALLTTWLIRLLDLVGVRLGFVSIAAALAVSIAAGIWTARGSGARRPDWRAAWRELDPGLLRLGFCLLLALIVLRLAGLGVGVAYRPLFPWDAWSQWATKARVWYEFGQLVPFVTQDVWLSAAAPGAYTDFAPHYPFAVPLLQMWTCFSLGRWDDSLMNIPWIQCAIALGLAFYGQARHWGMPPLWAMAFTYFLLSLPILDTHVALAGYADLFMGAYYGLAAMAFFNWVRTRDRWQGAMALFFAVACAFIKQPGLIWMLTFVPALWIAISPRVGRIGLMIVLGIGAICLLALNLVGQVELFGFVLHGWRYASAFEAFGQNLFVLNNWHLFWYLLVIAFLLMMRRLFSEALRSMTILVLTGFCFLGIVFFFTPAQAWAEDFTTLNRALLHLVPVLVFYLMVLWREELKLPGWFGPRPKVVISHGKD